MGNIKLSPTKLNRYPIDVRFIDCSKKTSIIVTIDEKDASIKFEAENAVVPCNEYFYEHYKDLVKIKKLNLPKLVMHCLIDASLENNVLYVYDIVCNDNYFSDKDIEKVIRDSGSELIQYCKPVAAGALSYDDYITAKGKPEEQKILIVRPTWYPADPIWDPEVKEINTFSFAFGE